MKIQRVAMCAALWFILLVILVGCATPRVESPFERCMAVTSSGVYTSDKIKAATWCTENANGGIQ